MTTTVPATDKAQSITSTFLSGGVLCAATLHLPASYDGSPLPSILMIHGWGGIQDALTTPFCQAFTAAGFAVMTFDYPSWGFSQGLPRNEINPWQRVRDADAALAHLRSQPQVDTYKIILWGSSFGGGHAVEMATEHPTLLGAIAQVPMLDGLAVVRANSLVRATKLITCGMADLLSFGKTIYVPIVAPEGEFSSMDRDGAFKALRNGLVQAGIDREHAYDNRVTARSVLGIAFYRPYKKLKNIKIPTLLVGGSRDTVAPFDEGKINKLKNPCITTHTIEANHFEPYFEPALEKNLAYQLAFLRSLLNKADT